jgi:cytochrome c-type biogenesis protein CcmH/NrfG
MGKQQTPAGGGRATTVVVAAITFVLGFYLGTVFMGLRTPAVQSPQSMTQPVPQGRSGSMQEQILALERKVQAEPGDVQAWTQLGHLYFDTEQPRKAIEAYEASLAIEPDNPDVLTDRGVMYRQIGQPQEAISSFERALSIDPDHRIARFNKGIVLLHDLNDREGAVAAWEELLERNPQAATPSGQPLSDMVEQLKKGK